MYTDLVGWCLGSTCQLRVSRSCNTPEQIENTCPHTMIYCINNVMFSTGQLQKPLVFWGRSVVLPYYTPRMGHPTPVRIRIYPMTAGSILQSVNYFRNTAQYWYSWRINPILQQQSTIYQCYNVTFAISPVECPQYT